MRTGKLWGHKSVLLTLLLCSVFLVPLSADVVFMKDGSIYVGTLTGPVQGGISYVAFGRETVLDINLILKTDKELVVLKELPVEVELLDHSVIRGRVVDFDADIGLFVDIGFGVLTIPNAAVAKIHDVVRSNSYSGASTQLRTGGGAYFPLAESANYFGPSWTAFAGAEWRVDNVRGLFVGVEAAFLAAQYLPSASVTYAMVRISPTITLKLLALRERDDFLKVFAPFISLSAGAVYIAANDPNASPSNSATLTAQIGVDGGLEIAIAGGFGVRLSGNMAMLFQQGSPFIYTSAALALTYNIE